MKMFDLSGRRALITGSTRGIGFALAGGLGHAGASIVLNGRDAATLDAAAATLQAAGVAATGKAFDAADRAAVVAAVDAIEAEQGPVDILVNNAGMQHRTPLEDFPEEAWHRLMRTNLDSAFFVGQAVARHMIGRKRGAIINIGSVQSELGRPGIAPYAASKGGLKMLTKGMAIDWGRHGIRVNGLNPGYFKTELNAALVKDAAFSDWLTRRTPLGRWGEVEELVGAAVFLASDAASFVTGHMLFVDGGVTSQL
ncbi:MAG TPA: glucose 1-dehydrogenase [Dongiaceae bacterium]|jgi:gluconate 5-dehydrogenase|nr:glucose 1-dehydrogenase [Dongiaceae bacterium]